MAFFHIAHLGKPVQALVYTTRTNPDCNFRKSWDFVVRSMIQLHEILNGLAPESSFRNSSNLRKHDSRTRSHGCKLHESLAQFLTLVWAYLKQLRNNCYRANIQEGSRRKWQQHVSPLETRTK